MENQTRFDLNAAIENWRQELAAQPNLASDARRELETHLRDLISEFQRKGLNDEESFWLARRRIGQPQLLGKEFKKAGAIYWNRPMALAAWGIFAISLFLPAYYPPIGMWPGYKCALAVLPWHYDYSFVKDSTWFIVIYYNLLNLPNLLMIASPILLQQFGKNARVMRWLRHLNITALILVALFMVEELLRNGGLALGIGCYVWVLSFMLLYLSVFPRFVPKRNQKVPKSA